MKKCHIVVYITVLFICVGFSADWHYYILESGHYGSNAIDLDSNNNPHILYYDLGNGILRYAYYDGDEWIYDTISDPDYWYGDGLDLVLDESDHPNISFHEWNHGDLYYGYMEGDEWVTVMIGSYEGDAGLDNSISLDSDNYPHIAYNHDVYEPSGRDLRYAYFDGEEWHIEVVDDENRYQGWFCSIALDSNDYPHIAYIKHDDHGNKYLSYAYWDGDSWNKEIVDELGDAVDNFTSIDVDSDNHPHIAYKSHNLRLKYAYHDGEEWKTELVDNGCEGDLSMKLDNNDYP
ncbi:MAG TPA: hypothetical protein ENI43_03665, partial [Firmicutes bacterium]|nr:hypothetical protein [Bacillota bacterium]